jgi:hypothetical protein
MVALAGAAVVIALVGCGGADTAPVGVSAPRRVERDPSADAGATAPSTVPPDFRTRLARIGDRFLSGGHAESFDAVVWANEAARDAIAGGGEYPEGAMLVEEAIGRDTSDAGALGLLVMEKRGQGWRFASVDPDGGGVSDERVSACASCHKDAPRDYVFAVLAPPVPSGSGAIAVPRPGSSAAARSQGTSSPAAAPPQSSSTAASPAMNATAPRTVATPAPTYETRSAGSAAAPSKR